ncbi:HAD family hydrolase [Brevibacillus fluminis]|uniref:HAD family hydrolase n=1 Tax=Brevibacillus fluminis TaxID=511487 RepID=A0A3M8DNN2_9BACL|nr:HAD family hydrolase [Brevibacillus fluminis]
MEETTVSRIKGILFDKDGTLLDFHPFFVPLATQLVEQFLHEHGLETHARLEEKLLQSIGLNGNQVDPKGILASGTSKDIYTAFCQQLVNNHVDPNQFENLETWITETIYQLTQSNTQHIIPTADLQKLFHQLRTLGIKVGIATADDWESTITCLENLGVKDYFEFIGTSDHYRKKPDPSMLEAFCEKTQLKETEVAVVGDTTVDLLLAKNGSAGLAVGVLSGVSGSDELRELADILLTSVGEIVGEDGRLIWEAQQQ